MTTTANYGWAYPTVGADADTWGATLNTTVIAIDAQVKANDTAAFYKDGSRAMTGKLTALTPTTSAASLNLPHGVAPTAPSNGDVWTTTAGAFVRLNGATKTLAFIDSNITGNAATATLAASATALATGRTIAMTGDVTWTSGSFDGTGDVTGTATLADGSVATAKLADDAVSNAKLANMAQATVKGRASGAGTGDPTDLTAAQLSALVNLAQASLGTASLGASGYVKIGSIYIQWGESTAFSTSTSGTATFPIAFPTACWNVVAVAKFASGSPGECGIGGIDAITTTGFTVYGFRASGSGTDAATAAYIAIGN